MEQTRKERGERGFIKWIVLAVVALALLKYFLDWSVFDAAKTEQGQETVGYTKNIIEIIWGYIQAPVVFIWKEIIWPILSLIWANFQAFLEWGKGNAAKGM